MSQRLQKIPPLYPALFAIVPTLSIAASNAGQFAVRDLWTILAAIVVSTCAVIAVAWLIALLIPAAKTDRMRAIQLASAIVMLVVIWLYYYEPIRDVILILSWRLSRDAVVSTVGLLATAIVLVILVRERFWLPGLTRFLTAFSLALIAVSVLRLLNAKESAPRAVEKSALVASLAKQIPVRGTVPGDRNVPKRDIYLIIADMHANAGALASALGFDNTRFEDSLRSLGFVVPRDMRSNYIETVTSLPSIVNFEQMTQLEKDEGRENDSYTVPKYLVENNRSARFLKRQQYKVVFFPSAWFPMTEHNRYADATFDARANDGLAAALRGSELRVAVLESTLLGRIDPPASTESRHLARTLAAIKQVPADTAATFALAHLMSPHPPFLVDSACTPLPHPIGSPQGVGDDGDWKPYLAQMRCLDRQLLDVATTLIAQSPTKPIILIVGDHGPSSTDPRFFDHPDKVAPAFIRERFGAFGAFYLPAGGDSLFTGRVSLVNVMRKVLRYYFAADLPAVPDSQFTSGNHPFDFYPVEADVPTVR